MQIRKKSMGLISLLLLLFLGCYDQVGPENGDTTPVSAISWKGVLDAHPPLPLVNDAYYNFLERVSFIFDGEKWDTITISGMNGFSLEWQGSLDTPPVTPQINWGYYNKTDKMSYIYTANGWETLSVDGSDGASFSWLGVLDAAPSDPKINEAYYNNLDKCTYIYTVKGWLPFTMDGVDGVSIAWQGSFATPPDDPQLNWAYRNTVDGASYLFNGSDWVLICKDGKDGQDGAVENMLVWLGSFSEAPKAPKNNEAYYNSSEKISYIFVEPVGWSVLCKDGKDGKDGTDGKDGKDGVSIIWLGEFKEHPENPQLNNCYLNATENIAYIFDGTKWKVLCVGGKDGKDGVPIIWKGELYWPPSDPQLNWAYYNINAGITYIYDGFGWDIMAQDGKDGVDGDTTTYIAEGQVAHGDTLVLNYSSNTLKPVFIGQYMGDDSLIHSWEYIPTNWDGYYQTDTTYTVYMGEGGHPTYLYDKCDLQLRDGRLLHFYNETNTLYKGGKFGELAIDGKLHNVVTLTENSVKGFTAIEAASGVVYLTCQEAVTSSGSLLFSIAGDGSVTKTVLADSSRSVTMKELNDGRIAIVYRNTTSDTLFMRIIESDGALGDAVAYDFTPVTESYGTLSEVTLEVECDTSLLVAYKMSDRDYYVGYSCIDFAGTILHSDELYIPSERNGLDLTVTKTAQGQYLFTFNQTHQGTQVKTKLALFEGRGSNFTDTVTLGWKGYGPASLLKEEDGTYLVLYGNSLSRVTDRGTLLSTNELQKGYIPQPSLHRDQSGKLFYSEGVERLGISPVTKHKATITLKRLSITNVALINTTGRTLYMILSLYKGRGVVTGGKIL